MKPRAGIRLGHKTETDMRRMCIFNKSMWAIKKLTVLSFKKKSNFKIQNFSWKITISLWFQFSHSKNKNNNLAVGSVNSLY